MTEQEISRAVQTVLEEMKSGEVQHAHHDHDHHAKGHVCKCHRSKMTLRLANALIEKVKERAAETGVQAVVAVADKAGRPVSVQCMDDAYIASYDIAVNKAFTSASLKMSTGTLSELAAPGGSLYGIQFTNEGRIVIFGGGEPLEAEGKIIGALGVSGGTAEQDTALAAYGRAALEEVIACL